MAERNDATPSLTTAGAVLMDELIERMETELPERDVVAVAAALTKGLIRGFKLGTAFVEDDFRQRAEQAGVKLNFIIEVEDAEPEEVDLWAERYGQGD
jgi:hypothetical protein